jgi:hypothetical protein
MEYYHNERALLLIVQKTKQSEEKESNVQHISCSHANTDTVCDNKSVNFGSLPSPSLKCLAP